MKTLHPFKSETARLSFLLLCFYSVTFFFNLGGAPLFDVDEGAFTEATREMMLSKNYLTTYLNGAPRFDKPILFYWFQLASVSLFGQNEFAFRLPSALAGAVWSFAIFSFMRRMIGARQAFFAAVLMTFSLQVFVISKAAVADALLNCFIAITMLSLLGYYSTGSKKYLMTAFATTGMGMLAKGPVAVLVPSAVSFIFCLQEKKLKEWFSMIFYPPGAGIFLLITLPWYLLEYQDQGMAFIEGFFFKHNISRFSTPLERHSGSLLYYFPVLLAGMMPFTGLLFSVAFRIRTLFRDSLNRFLILWFCFVFVFFSLSGTKLPHYIIYGYTPVFILMARVLPPDLPHPWRTAVWPIVFLLLLAALPLLLPVATDRLDYGYATFALRAAAENTGLTFMLVMTGGALLITAIQLLPRVSAPARLVATGMVFSLLLNIYLFPLAGKILQQPVKEAALLARQEGYKTVMWKVYYPSFLVYSQTFVERRDPQPGDMVLTSADVLEKSGKDAVVFYSRYGIVLARMMN